VKNNFQKYIPEHAINLVQSLIEKHKINLKIVNQRHTKHGDFRQLANGEFQITINNTLNPFQFLLTLIHEIAHHITHPTIFPNHMLIPLAHYLKNPKASTDSDIKLSLALKGNKAENGKNFVFELFNQNTEVILNKT